MNERPSYMTQGEKLFRNMFSGIVPGMSSGDKKMREQQEEEERRRLLELNGLNSAVNSLHTSSPDQIRRPTPMGLDGEEFSDDAAAYNKEEDKRLDGLLTPYQKLLRNSQEAANKVADHDPALAGNMLKNMLFSSVPGEDAAQEMYETHADRMIKVGELELDQRKLDEAKDEADRQRVIQAGTNNLFIDQHKLREKYGVAPDEEISDSHAQSLVNAYMGGLDAEEQKQRTIEMGAQATLARSQADELKNQAADRKFYSELANHATGGHSNDMQVGKKVWDDSIEATEWIENNKSTVEQVYESMEKIEGWLDPENEMGKKIRNALADGILQIANVTGTGSAMEDGSTFTLHLNTEGVGGIFGGSEAMSELRILESTLNRIAIPSIKKTIGEARFAAIEAQMVLKAISPLFSGGIATSDQVDEVLVNLSTYFNSALNKAFEQAKYYPTFQKETGITGIDGESKFDPEAEDYEYSLKPSLYYPWKEYDKRKKWDQGFPGGYRGRLKSIAEEGTDLTNAAYDLGERRRAGRP